MNKLVPQRHVPVPRHLPPFGMSGVVGAGRAGGRVMAAVDRVLDWGVPVLLALVVSALVGLGFAALADLAAPQPAACVSEVTGAGQHVCVPR